MSIINKISSSIKNRRMTLEEKITYLENLKNKGINLKDISLDYISEDGIIVNNVIINIKKYFKSNSMTIKQIIKCENLGITFEVNKNDVNYKINYLSKAKEEGINLVEIITNSNKYKQNSIYIYILDLREKYEKNHLTNEQVDSCIKDLNIIVSKEEKKEILLNKIKDSALKNIIFCNEINNVLM